MTLLPFLGPYQPDDVIAWHNGKSIPCAIFLTHVADCLEKLPDKQHVLNLCEDRYRFLVGFAAALLRGQTTLLPPSRAPKVIEEIGRAYSACYIMTDLDETIDGLEAFSLRQLTSRNGSLTTIPRIPGHQIGVIAFTSGSTGTPCPSPKSWESLVSVAQKTGERILVGTEEKINIVATVPHQHMYGLETSIMLPIQHGWSFYSGRPFYPEDIRSALLETPGKRILVSTPIHLRACVTEGTQFPELNYTLSATAPLPLPLAREFETLFQTKIIEIYGFAEAGTIATRRTVAGDNWKLLEGLALSFEANQLAVTTPYFSHPIRIPDAITAQGLHEFTLQGRPGNLINIGGHRTSLDLLNYQLTKIEGVIDGVFFLPDSQEDEVTRLIAFAVAPGKTPEAILTALRNTIAPVFLPRPLYLVDSLPRNPTGKLPKQALESLAASHKDMKVHQRKKGDDAHVSRKIGDD